MQTQTCIQNRGNTSECTKCVHACVSIQDQGNLGACSETAVETILRQELSTHGPQRILPHVFGCILSMHEYLLSHNFTHESNRRQCILKSCRKEGLYLCTSIECICQSPFVDFLKRGIVTSMSAYILLLLHTSLKPSLGFDKNSSLHFPFSSSNKQPAAHYVTAITKSSV